MAALKRADAQLAQTHQRTADAIDALERRAMNAVRRGDDDEAHRLLEQKTKLEIDADRLLRQRDQNQGDLDQMRDALRDVRYRVQHNAPRSYTPPTHEPMAHGDAFDRFSEIESQLQHLEADLEASAIVHEYVDPLIDPKQVRVEQELAQLARQEAVAERGDADDALRKLRQAMNGDD